MVNGPKLLHNKSYEDHSMLSIFKYIGFQYVVKVVVWGVGPHGGLEGSWFPWRGGTEAVSANPHCCLGVIGGKWHAS